MRLPFDHIIVTSDEPAGKMHHTQILFAEYLAKFNDLLFVDPPRAWKIRNLLSAPKTQGSAAFKAYNYWNRFPAIISFFGKQNEQLNEKRISSLLNLKSDSKLLIWHFDSYRSLFGGTTFSNKKQVKRIYHVIDPFYNNPIDHRLRQFADLIIITSPRIAPFYDSHKNKVIQLPQAVNVKEHLNFLRGPLPASFDTKTPYVVLLGTFSEDIDYDWLFRYMSMNISRLVLIGKHVSDEKKHFEALTALPQVEYLGEMEPSEFYPVLRNAKVGLVVYNERRRKNICSPLKALNYLTAEIPVVTNIDCEIPELYGEAIYMAAGEGEFISLLKRETLNINKEKVRHYLDSVDLSRTVHIINERLKGTEHSESLSQNRKS